MSDKAKKAEKAEMPLQRGVNFINILRANFLCKSVTDVQFLFRYLRILYFKYRILGKQVYFVTRKLAVTNFAHVNKLNLR